MELIIEEYGIAILLLLMGNCILQQLAAVLACF